MRKEGWDPYPFKIKYLIPLIIFLAYIFIYLGLSFENTPSAFSTMLGAVILLSFFFLSYIMGIRRIFFDLIIKLKKYDYYPLAYWIIGTIIITTIDSIIRVIFAPETFSITLLVTTYFVLGVGILIYTLGLIITIKDLKPISI
ncbi:MAG: hypothetical protein ACFFAN_01680 [Promethearchaeota archaeon]